MPGLSSGRKSDTGEKTIRFLASLGLFDCILQSNLFKYLFLNVIYTQNKDKNDTLAGWLALG
jgi:hypothetical protein